MLREKSIQDKYSQLLFTLILLFLIAPFLTGIIGQIIIQLIFLGMIISLIRTFNLNKINFLLYVAVAGFAFLFSILSTVYILPHGLELNLHKFLIIISDSINSIFIIMALFSLNKRIFLFKKVDNNTIKGGVAVFLLIGILWTFIYHIVFILDPNAFSYSKEIKEYDYLFYFSFTTLTTLGYGDVTPVNQFAMSLANLEAIVGMMYPSIFIARLVSLYTADELKERD
jgi:hypothetical protein